MGRLVQRVGWHVAHRIMVFRLELALRLLRWYGEECDYRTALDRFVELRRFEMLAPSLGIQNYRSVVWPLQWRR